MKKYKTIYSTIVFLLCFSTYSCKKQDEYLNVKRNIHEVVPTTIADFQAIMDDGSSLNTYFPTIGFSGSDNNDAVEGLLDLLTPPTKASYIWAKDIYQGSSDQTQDWDKPYNAVESCNIVLDGLNKISPTTNNQLQFNNAKGSALFFRSFYFYSLAQVFCKAYDNATASTDLGIVLRLTSDINVKSTRATVQQTYDQMINDLKQAISLLPATPSFAYRPSQTSANALLAKVYLSMGDYANAANYAAASLHQVNNLLDFNSSMIKPDQSQPFPAYPNNPEITFYGEYSQGLGTFFCLNALDYVNINATLYNLYDDNDLRKSLFFSVVNDNPFGNIFFRGSYTAGYNGFAGIATNEVYLISAESKARTGDITGALSDLNSLLIKRYKTGTFVPVTLTDPTALLTKILLERRKELPFTGQLRWEDLRRLNKDPRFAITLTRVLNGVTYTLPPNDPRYVLPIPDAEIQLSGIPQNQR